MHKKFKLEESLVDFLTSGVHFNARDPRISAIKNILPRWEIRTEAEQDPIIEETKQVRKMVKEVDDRYDKYLKKGKHS